jgi:hypothetical protein
MAAVAATIICKIKRTEREPAGKVIKEEVLSGANQKTKFAGNHQGR